MAKISKFVLVSALICLGVSLAALSLAEETTSADIVPEAQISAADLEVSNPVLLPESPFYFLKEWTRRARMAFTFNEIKKAELENKFTNEKLIELKKMTENGASSERIKKATENYQNAIDKIKERTDKIKERASGSEAVNKFLEKFTNQQVLQEKILQKLEGQVPEEAFEKIKEARERHIEKFGEVMQKLEDRQDKIKEKIENALQNGDASNPEILDKIKEKMPDDIREKLESAKEGVRERVNTKLIENAAEKNVDKDCPLILKPAPDFCKNGIIKVKRDPRGCATEFNCLIPSEQRVCTQEYNPVCGKDGKTYSNSCVAKNSNVEIDYKGECGNQNADCKKLWWFDNQNKTCQQKEFCGAYMYLGLQTFEAKNICEKKLLLTMPKEILWTEVLKILKDGQVKIASQTDNKIVRLTLKDGTEFKTTEPEIDDIFNEIEKCGEICKNIKMITE
jgi:hypothetical protein